MKFAETSELDLVLVCITLERNTVSRSLSRRRKI